MVAATTKTTEVSNFENDPRKMNDAKHFHGRLRIAEVTIEIAAADDDGAVYPLMYLEGHWSVKDIRVVNDAITSGTAYDFGLYTADDPDGDAYTAKDDDAYASAVDMSSARTAWTSIAHEARDVANVKKQVFEDAGDSEDPADPYVLAMTADTVGSAAGTISVQVLYTDGS